jgi:phosphoesterase RecJ-like protein
MNASSGGESAIELVPTPVELADQIDKFLEVIDNHERFLVVSHASPDGDAIGSTLAMGLVLEALGKEVVFYNRDPVPYNFEFLHRADAMVTEVPEGADIEVTIVLDCAEPDRVGVNFPDHGWGETIVVVDHHKTWDSEFADVYVRDVNAAATGELVYRLVIASGTELTLGIAESLYGCVMTDTGSFRYSNTSRTTFRIAGELIDAGVEPWRMTSHIYESEPKERLELLSLALNTLELSHCGRLAFLRIEDNMFEQTGTGPELTDGFINYARSIRGVEVATQLREEEQDVWRVSFRSRGKVDVSELAAKFGGGGHYNAAGCMIEGTSDQIVEKLSQALVDLLDTDKPAVCDPD